MGDEDGDALIGQLQAEANRLAALSASSRLESLLRNASALISPRHIRRHRSVGERQWRAAVISYVRTHVTAMAESCRLKRTDVARNELADTIVVLVTVLGHAANLTMVQMGSIADTLDSARKLICPTATVASLARALLDARFEATFPAFATAVRDASNRPRGTKTRMCYYYLRHGSCRNSAAHCPEAHAYAHPL